MDIFVEIGLIIVIATIISFVLKTLKQPLIIGYILTGIIAGPHVLELVGSAHYIELFSRFGIAILLFIIGINLKPRTIHEVGKVSLITGIGQIIITSILGFIMMKLAGYDVVESIYGSIALTLSSTIIVLKLLSDKGDLNKLYGKISTGFLLIQDIFAAIALLVISIIGSKDISQGKDISSIFIFLIIKAIILVIILFFFSKYILPKLIKFAASSQELLFIFSMAWGIGMASIFLVLGFSLEIGALVAGIIMASSDYSEEIASRMKPLRDFFILLFFVMLGSIMNFTNFQIIIIPSIFLSLFVLIGNPIIMIIIMNLLGYKRRTSFLTGLVVAQISEFSLILITLGYSMGHVSKDIVSIVALVGVITIAGSTYLVLYAEKLYETFKPFLKYFEFRKKTIETDDSADSDIDMYIIGYDRVGYDYVQIAQKMGLMYCVIDFDPKAINKLKANNINYYFGDVEDVDFLEEISINQAKIVISTVPDFDANKTLVSYYKQHNNTDGIIIVTSSNIKNAKILYQHGATFVVMSHYLGARYAANMIEKYSYNKKLFEDEKFKHMAYLETRAILTKEE